MFGLFGRSQELQCPDQALRSPGLNSRGVAEAVNLTILKQLKEASPGHTPDLRAYAAVAELITYCVRGLGASRKRTMRSKPNALKHLWLTRSRRAMGWTLLALHTGLIHASVVERTAE